LQRKQTLVLPQRHFVPQSHGQQTVEVVSEGQRLNCPIKKHQSCSKYLYLKYKYLGPKYKYKYFGPKYKYFGAKYKYFGPKYKYKYFGPKYKYKYKYK
jgi:hypothetical protein